MLRGQGSLVHGPFLWNYRPSTNCFQAMPTSNCHEIPCNSQHILASHRLRQLLVVPSQSELFHSLTATNCHDARATAAMAHGKTGGCLNMNIEHSAKLGFSIIYMYILHYISCTNTCIMYMHLISIDLGMYSI